MTSVEDSEAMAVQVSEDAPQVASVDSRKKNTSKPQNGRSDRGRDGDNRPASKDSAPRIEDDDDDETDLVPPEPVLEPNAEENKALLDVIRRELDELEQRVATINSDVAKAKDVREMQEAGLKDLRSELNVLRSQSSQLSLEKDELVERLKKLSETIKNQELTATKMRKDLRFKSEEETDDAIKQLSHRLETSSLDLKTEKDILKDLKKLNGDKDRIKEWEAQVDLAKANRFAHEDLFLQRQAKGAELSALRSQEKALMARMDAVRSGEGVPDGFNAGARITALLDEKARLVEELKRKRAELHAANVAFKLRQAEHRDYRRARQAYERKLERLEVKRRRAEAAARADKVREERRQRDAERKEARRREEARMLAVMEGCQLYVGGLAIRCDDAALAAHFARFGGGGAVRDAVVIRDPETGLSRGFGFVTLADADAGREAVKQCNGREAKGLCPQHGRMQVRLASKSKAQVEFEARRSAQGKPRAQAAGAGPA
eukprot:CAMPEP_0172183858 /NCGR_PEP_ID=MMETSP1050-20130122/19235_1 /TAXON_ID=233186 /ORGANISM="Cryptomonas curvata, Strain CCAP979/52" /LENGTH=490 /DNA_ID=CAMNT_0012857555 /DNA_START=59 /DNA_END=1528 /DNA_ORIENTATION=+